MVGNLGARSDVLDGPYDGLVPYSVGLSIRPARKICVTSEILSVRSVDRPTAVDLVEVAVAGSLLDRRYRKEAQARAGTADTESSLAGHVRHVRRFAHARPHRGI